MADNNGHSAQSPLTEEVMAWEHFCEVLKLKQAERDLLVEQGIESPRDYYGVAVMKGVEVGMKEKKAAEAIFAFDEKNVISDLSRFNLVLAWIWLAANGDVVDDANEFRRKFKKSFKKEACEKKRRAETEAEDRRLMEENRRYKTTKENQASASTFAGTGSRTLEGIGSVPPVYLEGLIPPQVKERFCAFWKHFQTDDNRLQRLANSIRSNGGGYTLKGVQEQLTEGSRGQSVQTDHLDSIADVLHSMTTERKFNDGLSKPSRRSLGDLGLDYGVATEGSFPDGYFHTGPLTELNRTVTFLVTAIVECKGSNSSAENGIGEGVANATNAAIAMARAGIPIEDVVVPVFSTTGSHVIVAAVYLLEPCFPTICFLTNTLCLAEQAASTKAAQILLALDAHAKRVEKYVQEKLEKGELTARPDLNMQLDSNKYHMKHMSDFFTAVGDKGDPPRVATQKSFTRLLELTSTLRDLKTVCLPIAIRLKDDRCPQDAILFEKLIGYRIGLPKETSERKLLIEAIEEAVGGMHSKRIIHMDLYLSNIMWERNDDGSYKVRIIDFDAAHKEGEDLTLNAIAAIRNSAVKLFEKLGNHATFEHDKLHLEVLKEHLDDAELQIREGETESDSKKRLDRRCSWLIAEYLQKKFET